MRACMCVCVKEQATKVSADGEQVEDDAARIHKRAEELEQFVRDTLLKATGNRCSAASAPCSMTSCQTQWISVTNLFQYNREEWECIDVRTQVKHLFKIYNSHLWNDGVKTSLVQSWKSWVINSWQFLMPTACLKIRDRADRAPSSLTKRVNILSLYLQLVTNWRLQDDGCM